jgi:prepilin peptidase CpaA
MIWAGLFLLYSSIIVITDFRCRRVPNKLLIVAMLLQSIWLTVVFSRKVDEAMPFGAVHWDSALIGFVLGLVIFYPLWRFRALGAGDVKFIAVLGFLLGPSRLFPVLLLGTVVSGLHALGMVLLMGWASARNIWRGNSATRRGVPYAAYLALAAIAWMVWKVSEGGLRITWGG